MEYKLYKNKVTLEYNDKKHTYKVNDKIVYGVTSITGVIGTNALMNWAVKLTKEKTKSEAQRLGWTKFCKQLDEVLLTAGREHYAVSKEARDLGTRVHARAEHWFNKKANQTDMIVDAMKADTKEEILSNSALVKFLMTHEFEPIELEGKCYSKKYGYAGTIDFFGKIDGKLTVLDYKTSKAIYESYYLQASAYAQAKTEEGHKIEQTMIVRLGKDGVLEVKVIKDWKKYLDPFLGASSIKNFLMDLKAKNFDKRSETKKITKK